MAEILAACTIGKNRVINTGSGPKRMLESCSLDEAGKLAANWTHRDA